MTAEPEDYSLVMPFIVVKSAGGEYDDAAFVAGCEFASIDTEMGLCRAMPQGLPAIPQGRYVHTGIIPQLDLAAMRHGYTIRRGDTDESGEWTWVEFTAPDLFEEVAS